MSPQLNTPLNRRDAIKTLAVMLGAVAGASTLETSSAEDVSWTEYPSHDLSGFLVMNSPRFEVSIRAKIALQDRVLTIRDVMTDEDLAVVTPEHPEAVAQMQRVADAFCSAGVTFEERIKEYRQTLAAAPPPPPKIDLVRTKANGVRTITDECNTAFFAGLFDPDGDPNRHVEHLRKALAVAEQYSLDDIRAVVQELQEEQRRLECANCFGTGDASERPGQPWKTCQQCGGTGLR